MESTTDSPPLTVGDGGVGSIEHIISKFDTLAGVAIRYGVEVSDIKKMNGLTDDLQMFARKSLKIPLPGRHPPSPIMSNGYHTQGQTSAQVTPPNDSFSPIKSLKLSSSPQRDISSSIHSLRDYYGLPPNDQKSISVGFEMIQTNSLLGSGAALLGPGGARAPPDFSLRSVNLRVFVRFFLLRSVNLSVFFSSAPPGFLAVTFGPPGFCGQAPPLLLGHHRKSKSEANGLSKICKKGNVNFPIANDNTIEKLVRRRKSEVDLNSRISEDLALQPKIVNSTTSESDPFAPKDSSLAQCLSGVRKSSSEPIFLQSETTIDNGSPVPSSIWPISVLNFTADFRAMSYAAIASPLFDGLPKPVSGRKNKAARD